MGFNSTGGFTSKVVKGEAAVGPSAHVKYKGQQLAGDALRKQLECWATAGQCEPDCTGKIMVSACVSHAQANHHTPRVTLIAAACTPTVSPESRLPLCAFSFLVRRRRYVMPVRRHRYGMPVRRHRYGMPVRLRYRSGSALRANTHPCLISLPAIVA